MLNEEQILQNKEKFIALLNTIIPDITNVLKYLEAVDYFNKPATAQTFKAYPGGLCEYALATAHEMGKICSAYCPDEYTAEDILKVALFKDIYRAELFYDAGGIYKIVEAKNRPTFGENGFSSYMIAKNFTDFTDEQLLAIKYSSPRDSYVTDINEVQRSYKLIVLTKMADLAVSYLTENN